MNNSDLDPSDIEKYKAACDQAVQAVGTPAQVAAVLGISVSTLSRAVNPEHPEVLLTMACAIRLERLSGLPIFASMFAAINYHHVVADDDGGPDGGERAVDLVDDMSSVSKETSEAVVSIAEAHKRQSPAAARQAMKEVGEGIRAMHRTLDRLAPIAARARS